MSKRSVEGRIGRPPIDQDGRFVRAVVKNPRLVRDKGFRVEALCEAVDRYEHGLLDSELEPTDVERTIDSSINNLEHLEKELETRDTRKDAQKRVVIFINTADALPKKRNGNSNGHRNGGE